MNCNSKGLDIIRKYEGCRLKAYKCPAGVWTIGYGHTSGVVQGMTITQAKADAFLQEDINKCESYVDKYVKIPLTENQYSALVSFTFNCGVGNLQKLVKNRNADQIADAIRLYDKANGIPLSGLTKRRLEEQKLFRSASIGTPTNTGCYPAYSGNATSIATAMDLSGIDSSYSHRKILAQINGIDGYRGTAEQNKKMLELFKAGQLKKD